MPEPSKIRWGVLGVARIAIKKVIPAMQRGVWSEVTAIASRDLTRAQRAAAEAGVPKAYGSYEALLQDPDIDAVYNPLPNHLHVPWTIRAAEAGKHVLCEKPIALTPSDVERLIEVRNRTGVLIQEAFMVRTHPRWLAAQAIVSSGRLGSVRAMTGVFSFYNDDPANIRNVAEYGGGAMMDIGCYLINTARMIFEKEPLRVSAAIERDPATQVDRLSSIILDFGDRHAVGTCSTQLVPCQYIHVLGTRGRLEMRMPFNAPPDRPVSLHLDDGSNPSGGGTEEIVVETCDQYTIQGDLFSGAALDHTPAPYPLEDSLENMRTIEAVFRSAESGRTVTLTPGS